MEKKSLVSAQSRSLIKSHMHAVFVSNWGGGGYGIAIGANNGRRK